MKKTVRVILVACLLAICAGCQSRTNFGRCIGAFDDRRPELEYRLSIRNTVLAAVFVETIFVPVLVVANQTLCPVGRKSERE